MTDLTAIRVLQKVADDHLELIGNLTKAIEGLTSIGETQKKVIEKLEMRVTFLEGIAAGFQMRFEGIEKQMGRRQ